ncbi:hypothetical protein [Actinophytocola sp.]|uniref:hypothetical protein n=1 Tax=Actinophytocola sp. TaxID=1872138 RepID=UPI002ED53256
MRALPNRVVKPLPQAGLRISVAVSPSDSQDACVRIQHRVSLNSTPRVSSELAALGVPTSAENGLASRLITFIVHEDHPRWPRIAQIIDGGAVDVVTTTFTEKEICQAAHVLLESTWHHGYPQPEDDFGYLSATYDLSDHCAACGVGARQKSSFRMEGEPKWGKKSVLQLNWVFDELFATPELWHTVFEPAGVERLPVLGKNGEELATVVQLAVGDQVEIEVSGMPAKHCPTCGRSKYLPATRGFFPAVLDEPGSLARTVQYFGSDGSAFRPIVARQEISRALAEHKVRGVSVRPLAGQDERHS